MGVVDDIKQKTDILEVIGQYTKLTKSGRTFRGICPFHSETRPSFFVYPEQQSWHCFGACNTGGDVFSFIMKKEGVVFADALHLLAEKAGITVPTVGRSEAEDKITERLYQINQSAAQYYHNLLVNSSAAERARAYIQSRGIKPETAASFQLGYSSNSWEDLKLYLAEKGYPEDEMLTAGLIAKSEAGKVHDRFRNKLMFPICDDRGRVTGFGARVLDDSLPKYINSPQTPLFDKSGSLYGINLAKAAIKRDNLAVMVEGYMDVIMAHQYGFANVVAPMGTSITEKQISQIKRLTKNVALALDADAAGEEAMLRCVGYENTLDAEVKVITLPAGKDPDEVIKEDTAAWERLVSQATPVIDYTITVVASRLDLTKASDKAAAVDKLLPLISAVKDVARQNHYLTRLSDISGVSLAKLEAVIARVKPDKKAKESKAEATTRALRAVRSNPLEEYLLSLLLQHPEIKAECRDLLPEYFENSENAEIFHQWQKAEDPKNLKELLDPLVHEHLDRLLTTIIPAGQTEQKYADCVLRLREKFLRNLEMKKGKALALEESGGTAEDITRIEEQQGIEVRQELKKVFNSRAMSNKEVGNER